MIDHLAQRAAEYIKSRSPEHPASIPVLRHALAIIINMVMIIVLTVVVTAAIGTLDRAIVMMITFVILRQITGGYHLRSGIWCVVVSTSLFVGLTLIHVSETTILIMTMISILLILWFAPSRIEKQSRIPVKYYPVLKVLGAVIVAINLLIGSEAIGLAVLAQSLLLIRLR